MKLEILSRVLLFVAILQGVASSMSPAGLTLKQPSLSSGLSRKMNGREAAFATRVEGVNSRKIVELKGGEDEFYEESSAKSASNIISPTKVFRLPWVKEFIPKTISDKMSKFRKQVFPVESGERKKFFMMSAMMFFIIYVYTVVRDTKDTLVVSHCGAEAITFLKVYGVLPASAIFMILYSKLSNVLSKEALFYTTCIPFFAFYLAFCLFLYPYRHILHPENFGEGLGLEGLKFLTSIVKYWTFSLFYVISELFGSVGVSVLFWQFANEIIPMDQAKRFYPLFGQLANLAPIAAGQTVVLSAAMTDPKSEDPFLKSIQLMTVFITLSGVSITALYKGLSGIVRQEKEKKALLAAVSDASPVVKKKKPKMGMAESFKFLLQSKYLGFLSILVIAYGLSINFTEVLWKSQVKLLYPNKQDYQRFMGNYSTIMGATTFLIIFAGSHIVKTFGWKVGALTTPVMMALLAAPFFGFIIFGGINATGASSKTVLATAVWIGLVQNILSKSIKYALFDPTKEMAYIPLDNESKTKGKAAIDVLGARIGKSGGALLQQAIVIGCGNIINGAPLIVGMFYTVIAAWIYAANGLGDLFVKLSSGDNKVKNEIKDATKEAMKEDKKKK
jgi:AAA family ATP:ADP antiporter